MNYISFRHCIIYLFMFVQYYKIKNINFNLQIPRNYRFCLQIRYSFKEEQISKYANQEIKHYNIELQNQNSLNSKQMHNNTLAQIKLRANQFIEDYERQVTERQYQKQKLKQNIMLQIMSNRHKSQASQSGGDASRITSIRQQNKIKDSMLGPNSQQSSLKGEKINLVQYPRSSSVPNALKNSQSEQNENLQGAQITFKVKKKKDESNHEYDGFKHKNINSQKESAKLNLDQNETIRQSKHELKQPEMYYPKQIAINGSQNKKYIAEEDYNQQTAKSKAEANKFKQQQYCSEQQINEQLKYQQQKGAIFLTMEQEKSIEQLQQKAKKNYTFDIVMDKSQSIDDIDQLRKKKILELQKRREQRMIEFKKQQQAKDKEKKSNSSLKNIPRASTGQARNDGRINDYIEMQVPKSRSKKRMDPDRQSKTNLSSHSIPQQESHYNVKPLQPLQQIGSYAAIHDKNDDDTNSYYQTPKTINSEYRNDKSKGKRTIFRQSPKKNDKSANKFSQQPKIEPKQRKNTFIKQSNKKLMITAITNVCLPGQLNRKQREKLIEVIQNEQAEFFVFLFKEYSRKIIKAIYVLDGSQTYLQRIYGEKAPQDVIAQNVQAFYRFDSGSREFKKLDGCKSFSLVVHAIDLA